MITTGIIYLIYALTLVFDLILPSWALPDTMMTAVTTGFQIVWFFNEVLPISACIQVFMLIIGFEFSLLLVRLVFGFISLVRGGGKVDI